MKIDKKNFIINFSIFFSIVLGTLIWDFIKFDFVDNGIIGTYSKNNHNGINDLIRYIVFISLPVFTYFFLKITFEKNSINQIKYFFLSKSTDDKKKNIYLNIYCLAFLLIVILEFLSINFPTFLIDSYHDGQKLSSAYKSVLDGSLWSGSYITVGIIFETLSTKFVWYLFDHISIGLARFAEIFYILCLKVSLIFLAFLVTKKTSFKPLISNIFFVISAAIFINITDYNTASVDIITSRDFPIILLAIFFLLSQNNKNIFIIMLISLLSIFSMFWGIDRGLVSNFLIILISVNFFLEKENKKLIYLFFFIILFWLIFYLINKDEFLFFLENTFTIYREMNYIFGIIHPSPFSNDPNSSRATKTLLFIILSLIIVINQILSNKNQSAISLNKFFLFLAVIGAVSYIYALGRSDGPHIKQVFGIQIIFFTLFILNIIFQKFSEIYERLFKFTIVISSLITFFIFLNNINFNNLSSFKQRFLDYVYLPDSSFLTNEEKSFVNEINNSFELGECIDLFTYDAAILYLLRKPSCTKYYYTYSLGSVENQKEFVEELDKKTTYVITNGRLDYWDDPQKKYKIVSEYLLENFEINIDNNYHLLKKIK